VLEELVRKSLVVANRSAEHVRFSVLETIRQFGEEQLVTSGGADEARTAHARYYAGRETAVLALWDSPRQREAYAWLALELANLRAAFRWATDREDLDTACAVAFYAAFLASWVDQHEPIGWAEDIIESARAADHPRLAQLYVMGAWCSRTGRVDEAVKHADAGLLAIESGSFDDVPYGMAASLGIAYVTKGQPQRWLKLCRDMIEQGYASHTLTRSNFVMALMTAGAVDEARSVARDLIAAAHETVNPAVACHALVAIGYALLDSEPVIAYDALRWGLTIAQDSGNQTIETYLAVNLSRIASRGDPTDALALITLALHNLYDSGSYSHMSSPLGVLAVYFSELGRHAEAATIVGFAATTFAFTAFPGIDSLIAQLRVVLGAEAYETFARSGAAMTPAAMTAYAFEQIDLARAEIQVE
jgi:hypothetical protein